MKSSEINITGQSRRYPFLKHVFCSSRVGRSPASQPYLLIKSISKYFQSVFDALYLRLAKMAWVHSPDVRCVFPASAYSRPPFLIVIYLSTSLFIPDSVCAQQHSYDPNTDNDGGQQYGDCLKDINRFCKAWGPLLFELENCLQSNIQRLTPSCRSHMENTDFRKYYRDEP